MNNIEIIKSMFLEGKSSQEISEVVGITRVGVNYHLKKLGLKEPTDKYSSKIDDELGKRILELNSKGLTRLEISKIVNITSTGIASFLKRNGTKNNVKKVDISRPCVICGTVFTPKNSDGVKKDKYKTCSTECMRKSIAISREVYSKEQINEVISLKKQNVTNSEIEKTTGVNINKIKKIVEQNSLFVSPEIAQQNAYKSKLKKNPNCMLEMREKHMLYPQVEFDRRLELIRQDILNGKGSASGLPEKHGMIGSSVVYALKEKGYSDLIGIYESTEQMAMKDWLFPTFPDLIMNDRKAIRPLEIDIYIPSKNIGIEYCGLFWHSEENKGSTVYHRDKMRRAQKNGIRLITIFEDEWLERKEQVKGYIKSILGMNSRSVGARECSVRKIEKEECNLFMEENHIQGAGRSWLHYGLFFEESLIGAVSFSDHHRPGNDQKFIVLDRLCFKGDWTVNGGASKLLEAAEEKLTGLGYQGIITWSDSRWSEGDVYKNMGFVEEAELPVDYSYGKGQKRFSKQSLKKTEAERSLGKSESELRKEQGYFKIWDCGKKRWCKPL